MKKNKVSKKIQFASTQDLLRKQREEEEEKGAGQGVGSGPTMSMLAAEVAAKAAVRSEKIRRKVMGSVTEDREVQSDGDMWETEGGEREGGGERGGAKGEKRKKRKKEKTSKHEAAGLRTLDSNGSSEHISDNHTPPTESHAQNNSNGRDYYSNIIRTSK